MICLIIKDGLGNQMFQYAYARCLQEVYRQSGIEEKLFINPYFIQHRKFKNNDVRDMSIQHLKLNPNVHFLSLKEQKRTMLDFKIKMLRYTSLRDLYNWRMKGIKPSGRDNFLNRSRYGIYYTFHAYSSYGFPLSDVEDKYIFGFFQSEQSFSLIKDIIKEECLVKDAPSSSNLFLLEHIRSVNSVCLHIRRGDYLNPKWKDLQICDFNYYNNAINEILYTEKDPVFFVFSNTHHDLEWIKANYHFAHKNKTVNLVYVDLNNPDYEELRLMYNCKHFILSNSTFSWWGAYLSKNTEKKVYVPNRWNLACIDDDQIYLENWIKIHVL